MRRGGGLSGHNQAHHGVQESTLYRWETSDHQPNIPNLSISIIYCNVFGSGYPVTIARSSIRNRPQSVPLANPEIRVLQNQNSLVIAMSKSEVEHNKAYLSELSRVSLLPKAYPLSDESSYGKN